MAVPLLLPVEDDRLARSGNGRRLRRNWAAAAGSALLLHALLLASFAPRVRLPAAPREAASVSLVMVATPRTAAVVTERVAVAAVATAVTEETASTVAAGTLPAVVRRLHVRPMRFAGAPGRRVPRAATVAARPGGSAGPISHADSDDGRVLAGLEAAIDQAVRRAATMPEAARRLHREGRVQVRFSYLDGTVGDVAVEQSGQSRLLDDAALRAVREAVYPQAPASVQRRRLSLVVWIDFRLSPA